jgi:hypothetical protein
LKGRTNTARASTISPAAHHHTGSEGTGTIEEYNIMLQSA